MPARCAVGGRQPGYSLDERPLDFAPSIVPPESGQPVVLEAAIMAEAGADWVDESLDVARVKTNSFQISDGFTK